MAIQLDKAHLVEATTERSKQSVDLGKETTTVTLPGQLRGRTPIKMAPRYWAVIRLTNGKRGEAVDLTAYFVAPSGEITPSVTYKAKWKAEGRHVAAIRHAGDKLYFSGDGDYEIRVTLNGAELCTIPFTAVWSDAVPRREEPDN